MITGHGHPVAPVTAVPDQPRKWVDQVARAEAFKQRHPHVNILTPREAGGREFIASWINASADATEDGTSEKHGHPELKALLDYLEARFDRTGKEL